MRKIPIGLFGLLLGAAPAWAIDYDKVDRTFVKVPAYNYKSPKAEPAYALLLFGRDARVRAWVVVDLTRHFSREVYVDRNGDGDLTGEDERFESIDAVKGIELADPDGETRYVITGMEASWDYESDYPDPGNRNRTLLDLDVRVEIKGPARYRQHSSTRLGYTPKDAAIAHFGGPLTIGRETIQRKVQPELALVTGEKPTHLNAQIATMSAKHGCWVKLDESNRPTEEQFSKGVFPFVDVEFPSDTKGGLMAKRRYPLSGPWLSGPVPVPKQASHGTARVTFSFDSWKEGEVTPSTIEIPVREPKPEHWESFLAGIFIVECPKNPGHRDTVKYVTRDHDCKTCGAKVVDHGIAIVVCPDGHGGLENKVEGITRRHQCQHKFPDGHICGKQASR